MPQVLGSWCALDEPLSLGKLTNDKDPPGFLGDLTFLEDFDTSDFVSFLFSEAMDAASAELAAIT